MTSMTSLSFLIFFHLCLKFFELLKFLFLILCSLLNLLLKFNWVKWLRHSVGLNGLTTGYLLLLRLLSNTTRRSSRLLVNLFETGKTVLNTKCASLSIFLLLFFELPSLIGSELLTFLTWLNRALLAK